MTCAQGLLRLLWGGARSWSATGLLLALFASLLSDWATAPDKLHDTITYLPRNSESVLFNLIHLALEHKKVNLLAFLQNIHFAPWVKHGSCGCRFKNLPKNLTRKLNLFQPASKLTLKQSNHQTTAQETVIESG